MLVHYMFIIMLCFIHCLLLFIIEDRSCFVHVPFCPNKDRSIVMLASSVRLCSILRFKALEWLPSRKYGTVWYHPASSKFWYLITLSFVNFQGKLTGTLWNLLACEASLFGLLCALTRGADFASTPTTEDQTICIPRNGT
jgi:hypothetical protein